MLKDTLLECIAASLLSAKVYPPLALQIRSETGSSHSTENLVSESAWSWALTLQQRSGSPAYYWQLNFGVI